MRAGFFLTGGNIGRLLVSVQMRSGEPQGGAARLPTRCAFRGLAGLCT